MFSPYVLLCSVVAIFFIGKFFLREGRQKERRERALELCGEWICTSQDEIMVNCNNLGENEFPCLILERNHAKLVIRYDPRITPGQKVLISSQDIQESPSSETGMIGYGNGYDDLLKVVLP